MVIGSPGDHFTHLDIVGEINWLITIDIPLILYNFSLEVQPTIKILETPILDDQNSQTLKTVFGENLSCLNGLWTSRLFMPSYPIASSHDSYI